MALSTMNSSLKRMWQKFFLLLRMALISPHWSNTSLMISSVAFSGSPPTNTVLQPGGRSRVDGGGRSAEQSHIDILCCFCGSDLTEWAVGHLLGFWGNRVQLLQWMISLMTGRSGVTGGGGARLIPAIMGFMGAMSPSPVSNLWIHNESADGTTTVNTAEEPGAHRTYTEPRREQEDGKFSQTQENRQMCEGDGSGLN